jgi:hypothetical protein
MSRKSLTSGIVGALLLCAAFSEAADPTAIMMCWARTGSIECGPAKSEDAATKYCSAQCKYWAPNAVAKAECREVWRCTSPGWAGVSINTNRAIAASVCGSAKQGDVLRKLKELCKSCDVTTYLIDGVVQDDSNGQTRALRMLLAAKKYAGTSYGHDGGGMVCSDLILAAAADAGIHVTVAVPAGGTVTTGWFAVGMGPEFRRVDQSTSGLTLDELGSALEQPEFKIPLGSVLVAEGHAALFNGVVRVGNKTALSVYDANDSDGFAVALSGEFVERADPAIGMAFEGHRVGEHVTRLQWGKNRRVKIFAPIEPSPASKAR